MRLVPHALFLLAPALTGQASREFTLAGESVAIYNVAGAVTVQGGGTGGVTVRVAPIGEDAGQLRIETGELRGRATLRVLYPADRIVYPDLGRGSNSSFNIRDDGTWGELDDHRGGRGEGRRVTVRGDGSGLEAAANLRVTIPQGRRVAIYLAVGRIEATNVDGDIRLDAMSADISAQRSRGRLTIDTGSGDITVSDATGDLSLDTGSGDVTISEMKEGDLEVDTGSGSVTGSHIAAGRVAIDAGSGDIRLDGATAPVATLETGSGSVRLSLDGAIERLHIESGSGDVTVRLPATVDATVDLETGSGDFDLSLPLQLVRKSEGQLSGRLGDGRGRIEIETGSGDIALVR